MQVRRIVADADALLAKSLVKLTFCFIRRHWVHTLLRVFLGRGAIGGVISRSTEAIFALSILQCKISVEPDGFRQSLTIFDSVRRYVEGESGDVRDPAVDDNDLPDGVPTIGTGWQRRCGDRGNVTDKGQGDSNGCYQGTNG